MTPCRLPPNRCRVGAGFELVRTSNAELQRLDRLRRIIGPEELFRESQDVVRRLLVDLQVRQKLRIGFLCPQRRDACAQLCELGVNLGLLFRGRWKYFRPGSWATTTAAANARSRIVFFKAGMLDLPDGGILPLCRLMAGESSSLNKARRSTKITKVHDEFGFFVDPFASSWIFVLPARESVCKTRLRQCFPCAWGPPSPRPVRPPPRFLEFAGIRVSPEMK